MTPSQDQAELNALWADTLIASLIGLGVGHACLSPGHRNAPLALALARQDSITVHTHMDERSGGFFGLGITKATGRPTALICTSGTAAANFSPAVIEAYYTGTPLIVITADRPPELRQTGANQTIDQINLYGSHTRFFADVATPDRSKLAYLSHLVAQAVTQAVGKPSGPVHLNVPLREPLTRSDGATPQQTQQTDIGNIEPPRTSRYAVPDLQAVADTIIKNRRGVVAIGPMARQDGFTEGLSALLKSTGYLLFAEATNEARYAHELAEFRIDNLDALLTNEAFIEAFRPEVVIRFGARPISKSFGQMLAREKPQLYLVDGEGLWTDADTLAQEVLRADPAGFCRSIANDLALLPANDGWVSAIRQWDTAASELLGSMVAADAPLFEGHIAALCAELTPEDGLLYVGNSMPVRYLERYSTATRRRPLTVLSNRGASGIDGMTSSALGAATGTGLPVCLYIGDTSFYHDLPGLAAAKGAINATLVVANNDGGGIYSILPVASYGKALERYFRMPHGLEFEGAAQMFGLEYHRVTDVAGIRQALESCLPKLGVQIVEVVLDPAQEIEKWRAVQSALQDLTP